MKIKANEILVAIGFILFIWAWFDAGSLEVLTPSFLIRVFVAFTIMGLATVSELKDQTVKEIKELK